MGVFWEEREILGVVGVVILGRGVRGVVVGREFSEGSATEEILGLKRENPLIFCRVLSFLFWNLRFGGKFSGEGATVLVATKAFRSEMGSVVVWSEEASLSRMSSGLVIDSLLSILLLTTSPRLCLRPLLTFSHSFLFNFTCFLLLMTLDFLGFQKLRCLALMLDFTLGLLPPAVLVGGHKKGLLHFPASSSISLLISAIVLNWTPPRFDRGFSRKRFRERGAPPC